MLIYLTLFPPQVDERFAAGTLVVLTPGVSSSRLPGSLAAIDGRVAGRRAAQCIEHVPDLGTALRRHADSARLRIIGGGLPPRDHRRGACARDRFRAPRCRDGMVDLSTPASRARGQHVLYRRSRARQCRRSRGASRSGRRSCCAGDARRRRRFRAERQPAQTAGNLRSRCACWTNLARTSKTLSSRWPCCRAMTACAGARRRAGSGAEISAALGGRCRRRARRVASCSATALRSTTAGRAHRASARAHRCRRRRRAGVERSRREYAHFAEGRDTVGLGLFLRVTGTLPEGVADGLARARFPRARGRCRTNGLARKHRQRAGSRGRVVAARAARRSGRRRAVVARQRWFLGCVMAQRRTRTRRDVVARRHVSHRARR